MSRMDDKPYTVTLRSKSEPHKFYAATIRYEGGKVIFTNSEGEEVGRFSAEDVIGQSIDPEMPSFPGLQ